MREIPDTYSLCNIEQMVQRTKTSAYLIFATRDNLQDCRQIQDNRLGSRTYLRVVDIDAEDPPNMTTRKISE